MYKLRYLDSYIPGLYNGATCPLCPSISITGVKEFQAHLVQTLITYNNLIVCH